MAANTPIYAPNQITFDTADPTQVAQWAQNEFQVLSRALTNINQIQMSTRSTAPPQPRTGLVAYADGVHWDPGQGEGMYEYTSAGVWKYLGIGGGAANTGAVFGCGYFGLLSATQVQFFPYNGNLVRINNKVYTFGVVIGTNSGLAANTTYFVYLYDSGGGTLAMEFSATSYTNNGFGDFVKSGDNTRLLVGMVYTNGSAQFQDNGQWRGVISWFNKGPRHLGVSYANSGSSSINQVFTSLAGATNAIFCTWGSALPVSFNGQAITSNGGSSGAVALAFDAVSNLMQVQYIFGPNPPIANLLYPFCISLVYPFPVGAHNVLPVGCGSVDASASTLTSANMTLWLNTLG